ncbi:MAG TPA: hypothetical protein DD697_00655 [Candidatus Komeilibacteria bacterium]|nr:hypothetical protein [Candidatus Komeilibacteria bacterium]
MLIYLFFIFIFLVFATMLYAGFSAAPWLPSWKKDMQTILAQAQIQPGETVADLGCGDGRWLLAAAKHTPARLVIGYEISLLMYCWSRIKLLFGNYPQIKIKYRDFYFADFSQYDVILCFLTPRAMRKLAPKLNREMRPGARLVSYAFSLPGKQSEKVAKVTPKSVPVYLYKF